MSQTKNAETPSGSASSGRAADTGGPGSPCGAPDPPSTYRITQDSPEAFQELSQSSDDFGERAKTDDEYDPDNFEPEIELQIQEINGEDGVAVIGIKGLNEWQESKLKDYFPDFTRCVKEESEKFMKYIVGNTADLGIGVEIIPNSDGTQTVVYRNNGGRVIPENTFLGLVPGTFTTKKINPAIHHLSERINLPGVFNNGRIEFSPRSKICGHFNVFHIEAISQGCRPSCFIRRMNSCDPETSEDSYTEESDEEGGKGDDEGEDHEGGDHKGYHHARDEYEETDQESTAGRSYPSTPAQSTPIALQFPSGVCQPDIENQEPFQNSINVPEVLRSIGIFMDPILADFFHGIFAGRNIQPGEALTVDSGPRHVNTKENMERILKSQKNPEKYLLVKCKCEEQDAKTYKADMAKPREVKSLVFEDDNVSSLKDENPMSHDEMLEKFKKSEGDIMTAEVKECPYGNHRLIGKDRPGQFDVVQYAKQTTDQWAIDRKKKIEKIEKEIADARDAEKHSYKVFKAMLGFEEHILQIPAFLDWLNDRGYILLHMINFLRKRYGVVVRGGFLFAENIIPAETLLVLPGSFIANNFLMDPKFIGNGNQFDTSCLIFGKLCSVFADPLGRGNSPIGDFFSPSLPPRCNNNITFIAIEECGKQFAESILGKQVHEILCEPFQQGREIHRQTFYDVVKKLGVSNKVIQQGEMLTGSSNDSSEFYSGIFSGQCAADEKSRLPEGTECFKCGCGDKNCSYLYTKNMELYPELSDQIYTGEPSIYADMERQIASKRAYDIQQERSTLPKWGNLPVSKSNFEDEVVLEKVREKFPSLDLDALHDAYDKRDKELARQSAQSFEEFAKERDRVAPRKKPETEKIVGFKLDTISESPPKSASGKKRKLSPSVQAPDVDSQEKRAKSESGETIQSGSSSGGRDETISKGRVCQYCSEQLEPGDRGVVRQPSPGKFVRVCTGCWKETCDAKGFKGICYICNLAVKNKDQRKKISHGKRTGEYIHTDCRKGNVRTKPSVVCTGEVSIEHSPSARVPR